jgi:glycosyltransferase involved in cell wall biosynthesis
MLRILMGFYFFPRGGSAYVARRLALRLPSAGAQVRLITGSLRTNEGHTRADIFFAGIHDVRISDFTPAVQGWSSGQDPLLHHTPLHASYEERDDAPDRVLGQVSPDVWAHQQRYWAEVLRDAHADQADVIHLHHLTPQLAPALETGRPVLVHLHGTELKFLSACREHMTMRWPHRDWARVFTPLLYQVAAVVAVSAGDAALAVDLLNVPAENLHVIPNGIDTEWFDTITLNSAERRALWSSWLVSEPRGWDESGVVGSIRYTERELDRLFPVNGGRLILLCVCRFLDFKRLPLLLESFARITDRIPPATLVIWGGFPGECEGRHPAAVVRDLGLENVVFTGFRGHDDLRLGLNCADLLVNAARHEPYGQILVEAMATGLPIVAADSGGPATFVRPHGQRATGWLFDPDNDASLSEVLVAALRDRRELRGRGARARTYVRENFAWQISVPEFMDLYQKLRR